MASAAAKKQYEPYNVVCPATALRGEFRKRLLPCSDVGMAFRKNASGDARSSSSPFLHILLFEPAADISNAACSSAQEAAGRIDRSRSRLPNLETSDKTHLPCSPASLWLGVIYAYAEYTGTDRQTRERRARGTGGRSPSRPGFDSLLERAFTQEELCACGLLPCRAC
jgi:hypothetical protein